jgi:hypothetical protein
MSKKKRSDADPIKPPYVQENFTEEQIQELLKCSNSFEYFATHWCYIQVIGQGGQLFEPFDYQKQMMDNFNDYGQLIFMCGRQLGKCHHADTKYKIKNKITGEIIEITAQEFHQMQSKT